MFPAAPLQARTAPCQTRPPTSSPSPCSSSSSIEVAPLQHRSPQLQPAGRVDFEHLDGRTPHGRQANQREAVPSKVIAPAIPARMKQPHNLARVGVNPGEVGALVQVAVETGQSQVLLLVSTPMLPGDDVLDMKPADRLVLLAQTAILATVAGPIPHPLAQRGVHHPACA